MNKVLIHLALPILGLWMCAFFFACVGCGSAFLKLLGMEETDWGLSSGLGLSLLISIGSLLNLLHAITRASFALCVIFGSTLFGYFLFRNRNLAAIGTFAKNLRNNSKPRLAWLLLGFICLLIAGRLVGQLRPSQVDLNDDRQAYLAFPAKMLATGSYAADPFSERRITSSLGGYTFLSTYPLVVGDVRSIAMMDQGIGLLILVAAMASIALLLRVPLLYTLLLIACVVATPIYRHNATAALIGAGLLASLVVALLTPALSNISSPRHFLVAGIMIGALCSLKSTFIPPAFLIYGSFCVFDMAGSGGIAKKNLFGYAGTFLVAVTCLLPWCIATRQTCGTALYPLLGRGFDAASYGRIPVARGGMTHVLVGRLALELSLLFIALCSVLVVFGLKDRRSSVISATLGGAAAATFVIAHSAFPTSFWRYTVPFALVALWIAGAILLSDLKQEHIDQLWKPRKVVCAAALMLMTLLLARGGGRDWSDLRYHGIKNYWTDLRTTLSNQPLLDSRRSDESTAMQNVIPVGAPILAHLDNNFAFDFSRNPVLICDSPGMSGPPPGPPVGDGPEAWALYFKSNAIRYVAFSRASAARGLSPGAFGNQQNDKNSPLYDPMANIGGEVVLKVNRDLLTLSDTRKRLYDNGNEVVIDLDAPLNFVN